MTAPSGAFHSNRLKRLTSYPKRYLADTALSLALAGVDAGSLGGDPALAGRYLESYVMQQLRPQVDAIGGVLTHMRTGAGEHEVDAVVEVGRDVYAIEVKLGVRPVVADAGHLVWLRDRLGDRFLAGFVANDLCVLSSGIRNWTHHCPRYPTAWSVVSSGKSATISWVSRYDSE